MSRVLTTFLLLVALAPDPSAARGLATETLEMNPDFRDARSHIAAGRFPQAIALLMNLREDYPPSPEISNWIAYSHRKMKDYSTSKAFYDEALSINPNYLPALEYQGEWFIETGDLESARKNLARLKTLCGECHEYKDLAESLAKYGR
ncbi:MAG: tetratricopeptide repeat protein [Beijerinckiaceae bacterium]